MATVPVDRPLRERIRSAGITSWALIGIAAVVVGLLTLLWFVLSRISVVFAPLAIAIILTYLLNPLVKLLQRRRVKRGIAVLIIYVLFLAVVGTIMRFLIPKIAHQISSFISDLPSYAETFAAKVNSFLAARKIDYRLNISSASIRDYLNTHRDTILSVLGGVRSLAGQVVHFTITFIVGIVLSVYFLLDLPKIQARTRAMIPARQKDEVLTVGNQVGVALGGFFRGQLLVALFVGVASAIGLTIVKVPFAIVIGMIAGLFNLVPLIGPFIGAIPAVAISLLSDHPIRALYGAIALLVVQQIDNHLISPNVMGRTVKLHPVTVMVALLIGGTVAGIFGMLLTIPIVATVKIIAGHLWSRRAALGMGVVPIVEPPVP